MASFSERAIRAARLDVRIYEEVEADKTATGQAMGVVILSSIAAGIGAARSGAGSMIALLIAALIGWFIWAFLTYLIGTRLLPEPQTRSDVGELLRTTGFASAPGILRVFGLIPLIGWILMIVIAIWMLVAMIIAVRQALDYTSTGRAVAVCLIGWLIYIVISVVLAALLGIGVQS